MRILVVDDNATNRKLLRVTLAEEGITTVEAGDGIEALMALDREPVDAIISDILMPRMDGYRLCYEVRASKKFCHLPFIIYTSTYTSPSDEKTGLDLGADKFLRRPSPAKEIVAALRALTGKPGRARTGPIPAPFGLELMKEYSEALIGKLEERNSDLERAGEQLLKASQVHSAQARELERAREELQNQNAELEMRVRERTSQLEAANRELDAFSHSAAHDMRAPLRAIVGYSGMLLEGESTRLSPEGVRYLEEITASAQQMNDLIEDLLELSRISRCDLLRQTVDLSGLARDIVAELERAEPERHVETAIDSDVVVQGDEALLRIALGNLLNNAWKFTSKTERARIEFGTKQDAMTRTCIVRDNGAGFDMAYADKLFRPFQRLHSQSEFPGTGVGLATVERIIRRHGGRIWAESEVGRETSFYFTLSTSDAGGDFA